MPLPSFQRLPIDEPLSEEALRSLPTSRFIAFVPAPLAVAKVQPDDTVEVTMPVAVKSACQVDVYPIVREGADPTVHIADAPFSLGRVQPGQPIQIGVTLPKWGDAAGFWLVYNGHSVATVLRMHS